MNQKQEIEEMGMVNAMLESDLLAATEKIRDLEAEVERLTKERDDHGPEGRNYTNGQYVELLMKYEAMREELEELIEDYHRRQQSATTILDDPKTIWDQRNRVQGKKAVYRDILLELNRILPVKGEGEQP